MINFNNIPNSDDWGDINPADYYPDNDYENFLGKSFRGLIEDINKPNGIGIISSVSSIPLVPFHFYTLCILKGIKSKEIPLNNYFSEFYFHDLIWAIEEKFTKNSSSKFADFIEDINTIIDCIRDNRIATTYSQEEKEEIFEEAKQLIGKIRSLTHDSPEKEADVTASPD